MFNADDRQMLRRIDARLGALLQGQLTKGDFMKTYADLIAEVHHVMDVEAAAKTALDGIKAQLAAAVATGDPVQIQAAIDGLEQATAPLAASIANTDPTAPAPTV